LRIDFRSLDVTPIALELDGYRLVTLDSGDQHANAASGYNERREQCARAAELMGVDSLREARIEQLEDLPEPLDRRVRHVVSENERVEATIRALEGHDLDEVGRLMNAAHASLRDCYEVSTPAVEAAVATLADAGAVGARIMGGGFGGHVLGLLTPGACAPAGAVEVRPGPGARVRGS
jgi:galactokinase